MAVVKSANADRFWQFLEETGFSVHNSGIRGNVRLVTMDGAVGFLYVRASNPGGKNYTTGYWGVNKNILTRLQQKKSPWALVLLEGSVSNGYWFDSETVQSARKGWSFSERGCEYKI